MKNRIISQPTIAIFSVCFTLMIGSVQAADLVQFSNGNIADADDVNANFNELETRIETISLTPGPVGPQGAAGPQGPQGPAGADAVLPVGAGPGDLLYWDGSVWQLTPAPPVTAWIKDPSLHVCNGVPTWSTSGCTVYAIGDKGPAGGIVFYVINGGYSGLEAARTDLASAPWGCSTTSIPGAVGTAIGTGRQNTTAIISDCPDAGIAARLAAVFKFGGFGDWFLPSRDELNELFVNRVVVGSFASNVYWSSSEIVASNAWLQIFIDGNQLVNGKFRAFGVRAVRAF